MAGSIDGWSKFINIYDFFQFLLPGLVLLIGISLILAGTNAPVFAKLAQDALPENEWLQGAAVVIIAYVLGLLISWPARKFAELCYPRRLDPNHPSDFPSFSVISPSSGVVVRHVSYDVAWVILRESKDKESYNFCYYLWGLEAMFRGVAAGFVVLGIGFWFYELIPGRADNAILFGVFLGLAWLMLWSARGYFRRLLGELQQSALEKARPHPDRKEVNLTFGNS
jgi:hypothetical protein